MAENSIVRVQVDIPEDAWNMLEAVATATGISEDDLIAGACHVVFKKPSAGVLKRIARKAYEYKLARLVSIYYKPKNGEQELPPQEDAG